MAIIEQTVCAGPDYTIALVFNDATLRLTAVHGDNARAAAITLRIVIGGATINMTCAAQTNSTVDLAVARAYTEITNWKGSSGIAITNLRSIEAITA